MAGLPEIQNLTFMAVTQTLGGTGFSANCSLPEVGHVIGIQDGGLLRFQAEMGPVVPLADAMLEVWPKPLFGLRACTSGFMGRVFPLSCMRGLQRVVVDL